MKIGVVGSGRIVRECLNTIRQMEQVECIAMCVRPASEQRGRELADEFGVADVYTSYGQFLEDCNADFVYIGVVNGLHSVYAREALEAGKNVILEKPFTPSAEDARNLARMAMERNLFLFEAITTLYCPMFRLMEERLHELGDVRMVQCNFSQYSSQYDRYVGGEVPPVFDPAGYGGSLYDINVYNLHLVTKLFGEPQKVRYHGNRGFNGVDTSGMAVLKYHTFSAVCCGAKDSSSPGFAMIQGTQGYMHMKGNPNACPALELDIGGEKEFFSDPKADLRMAAELTAFEEMWRKGDQAGCHSLLEHSVMVMELIEKAAMINW